MVRDSLITLHQRKKSSRKRWLLLYFARHSASSIFHPSKTTNFRNLSNFHVPIPPKFQTAFDGTNLFSIRLIALRTKIIHRIIFVYAVSNFRIPPLDLRYYTFFFINPSTVNIFLPTLSIFAPTFVIKFKFFTNLKQISVCIKILKTLRMFYF